MKNLLMGLLSLTVISNFVLPIVSCNNKTSVDVNEEQSDNFTDLQQEVKDHVLDFFLGMKSKGSEDKNTEDYNIINSNNLRISALENFIQRVKNTEIITDLDIIKIINNFIINTKLPLLQKDLKNKFSDLFSEEVDDFISLETNETTIKNDSKSMKVTELKKILDKESINNKITDVVTTNFDTNGVIQSIIKLNIKTTIKIKSKYLNMTAIPEFDYYITDKEKAAQEIVSKLKNIVKTNIQENLSNYYQEFLNMKSQNGIIEKKDVLNFSSSKFVKDILLTYFSLENQSSEQLDFKFGKISTKLLESKTNQFDLSRIVNFEVNLFDLIKEQIQIKKVNHQFLPDKMKEILKDMYQNYLSSKENNLDNSKLDIIKMSLSLSRVSIMGFAIGELFFENINIRFDIAKLVNEMSLVFEYFEVIMKNFLVEKKSWRNVVDLFALTPIWDPKKYEKLSDSELKKNVLSTIENIITFNLHNWMMTSLRELIDNDGEDENLNKLEIKIEKQHIWEGVFIKYKDRINAKIKITFKFRWITFVVYSGDIYWYTVPSIND